MMVPDKGRKDILQTTARATVDSGQDHEGWGPAFNQGSVWRSELQVAVMQGPGWGAAETPPGM